MEDASEISKVGARLLTASIDARLIAVLDFYSRRDLLADPPRDSETLQRIGITADDADRRIRDWVNDAFRSPNGWATLPRDGLPVGSTTYAKLRDYCTKP